LRQRELTERDLSLQTQELQRSSQELAKTTALLKQRNQDLDSFVAIATDAILVRDLNNRIRFWNKGAERIYGWSVAEALDRDVRDLLYSDGIVAATVAFTSQLLLQTLHKLISTRSI
jgi:PAS domain-containing protein